MPSTSGLLAGGKCTLYSERCGGAGRLTGMRYQYIIETGDVLDEYSRLIEIYTLGEVCKMKQFQKQFIKEVVAEVTVLSALIILPLAFLGPGWTRKQPSDRLVAGRFRQEHPMSEADQEDTKER